MSRLCGCAAVATIAALTIAARGDVIAASGTAWVEVRTPNSVVVSDAGGPTAQRLAAELEQVRASIRHLAGDSLRDPGEPVVVLAVRNQGGLKQLLPQYWERRGPKPAGAASSGPYTPFVALRTNVRARTRSRLLAHEYVHILLRAAVPEPPAWLDEGVAEFWSTAKIENGAAKVGEARRDYVDTLRSRDWIPLRELLKIERGRYPTNSRRLRLQYAQSWALVHFLLLGPRGAELRFAPALAGTDIPALERELRNYISSRLTSVARPFTPPVARIPAPSPLALPRSLALRGLFLVHGERPAAAVPLLQSALAAEPAEPLALEGLATYYFLQNEPGEAKLWFKRAVDAAGASYRAHYYYGLLMQENRAISEHHLRKALELNPGFAPALQRIVKPKPGAEN